ncbi:hypothetical protein ACIGEH_15130, partial [Bacillus altitudinis]|uniref:hypothetical protein n=1 Tax=Bacillus altitudinis TaxID=293387 RepID=UPI0037C8C4D8
AMSSVKHIMFLSKNVKTPLSLDVKVGFVYGLKQALQPVLYYPVMTILMNGTLSKKKTTAK